MLESPKPEINTLSRAPKRLPHFHEQESESEQFEISQNILRSMLEPWISTIDLRLSTDDSLPVADRMEIIRALQQKIDNTLASRSFYMHAMVRRLRDGGASLEAVKKELDPKIMQYIVFLDGELEKLKNRYAANPNLGRRKQHVIYPSAGEVQTTLQKRRVQDAPETRTQARPALTAGVFNRLKNLIGKN
ncbi:MAG: hypothetical protein V1928_01745 [Parcubacteria group bacterium]